MTSQEQREEGGRLEVVSPFDGSLIKSIPVHDAEDAEVMLKKALSCYSDRDGWLDHHQRIAVLEKLALSMQDMADEFALLIASEGGKPLLDAKVEVARAIDGIGLAIKELAHVMRGEEIPMGHTPAASGRIAFTTDEPIGVVVAVSAFNHPLNLIVHQVVPAIARGMSGHCQTRSDDSFELYPLRRAGP